MSEDQEIVRVIAMRCEHVPLTDLVMGSIRVACDKCGAQVWIAPSSQRIAYTQVLCWECAQIEYAKRPPEDEVEFGIAPGSIEEALAILRRKPPEVM